MNLLIAPFINALFGSYYALGNLGWSIVLVTVGIRLVLLPLLWPSMKSAEKIRELTPKLKKLQERYKGDKQKLATAQMELYKQEGVNPLSGCLPQLFQVAVLIMFYSAFNQVVMFADGKLNYGQMNTQLINSFQIKEDFRFDLSFLGSNLSDTPAAVWGKKSGMVLPLVLLLGSGILQYLAAKLMMPSSTKASAVDSSAYVKATPGAEDDMAEMMRTQSLYFMPLMTVVIGWSFGLGLLLYWFVNSAVMVVLQVVVSQLKVVRIKQS